MKYLDGSSRPAYIEMIRDLARNPGDAKLKAKLDQTKPEPETTANLLDIRSANDWLEQERDKPRPQKLFGDFWLQGELCFLFADTNMGKSILAVQLGDSISRQQPIAGFGLQAPPQPVLYIDFELSSKQFEVRYTHKGESYQFDAGFFRAEVDLQAQTPNHFASFNDYMSYAIHRAIKYTGAQVVIIDNITCLGDGAERASRALAMMRQLKMLKTRHDLSILVLAHTPKRRPGKPIGRNDLGGSKLLINFADSAFAMAESGTQPGSRYLKQVKQRSGVEVYGANNVCLFKLERQGPFLGFSLVGNTPEYQHLREAGEEEREMLMQSAATLKLSGHSQRQIATELRLSLGTVNRLLRNGAAV